MSENVVHTTDGSFDADVLQSDKPVLIDFWAEWCAPCKMIAPLIDQVADEYGEKLSVVKMDIQENPNTPNKFAVRSIPTLMIFKDGVMQAQINRAVRRDELLQFIDSNI